MHEDMIMVEMTKSVCTVYNKCKL